MKHLLFAFTAILGFIILFIYVHKCKNSLNNINKGTIVEIFFNSATTVGGLAFLVSPFIPSLRDVIEAELFSLIGGVIILATSTENLKNILSDKQL